MALRDRDRVRHDHRLHTGSVGGGDAVRGVLHDQRLVRPEPEALQRGEVRAGR
jgi:hypothetical protein